MRSLLWPSLFIVTFVTLAGCVFSNGDDGPDYTPRTIEATLVVEAGQSNTIPLYTLNDGERQMRVVAMGFTTPDQDELEVPNPMIRLKEGDTLRLTIINNNALAHTFHMHGGLVPWEMDGVPYLTQLPIHQGEQYTYVFEDVKAGTYWYHCHVDVAHHIDLGMYGGFIVEEVDPDYPADQDITLMLDEWDNCHVHGNLDPVQNSENNAAIFERNECLQRFTGDNVGQNQAVNTARSQLCAADPPPEIAEALGCGQHGGAPPGSDERAWYPATYPVYVPEYNTYTINGKAFPDTLPIVVEEGQTVRIRLINVGEEMHSMHLHGHNFLVTHRDGYQLSSPFRADTLGIMPGERYDLVIEMDNPGYWAFHDHVGLNVMNDHISPGGMFTCIAYDGFHGIDAQAFETSLGCSHAAQQIFGGHSEHGDQPIGTPVKASFTRSQAAPVVTGVDPVVVSQDGHGPSSGGSGGLRVGAPA